MREKRIHQVLVVGDNGVVEGLITLEDVVAELIGGVSDEFKDAPARAILLPDGSVRLPGAMRVDQAAQVLGADWKGAGDTIATFIPRVARRRPSAGRAGHNRWHRHRRRGGRGGRGRVVAGPAAAGADGGSRMTAFLIITGADPAQRHLRRRRVRDRRRAARVDRRACGAGAIVSRRRCRRSCAIRSGRTSTSPRRNSASPSRAWGSACMASTFSPTASTTCSAVPARRRGWCRTASPASSPSPSSPTSTSSSAR